MNTLSLVDLLSPYALGGAAIGQPLHELLSILFVQTVETAFDDTSVTVSGMARFSADANTPTFTPPFNFNFAGAVNHNTTRTPGAWWDFPDIAMPFRLTAQRAASPVADLVVKGGGGSPPLNNANVASVLTSLEAATTQRPGNEGPGTVVRLELLLEAISLHLPFLRPAKLQPDGTLAEDTSSADVIVTFPKLKFGFQQTPGGVIGTTVTDPQLTITLDSWGGENIDDPAGSAYAELIRFTPPYAFFGAERVFGLGFQSVTLVFGATAPPAVRSKFGFGDDFQGVYLPDVRVFLEPGGLKAFSADVSAREMLIGFGPDGGLSAIFGLDLVNPAKAQSAVVSIYDITGHLLQRVELADTAGTTYPVSIPADTYWTVDVNGGTPPYKVTVDGQVATASVVELKLPAGTITKTVPVHIEDVHAGGQSRDDTFLVSVVAPSLTSGQPAPQDQPATLTVVQAAPPGYSITMLDAPHSESVTLVFTPPDPTTVTVQNAPVTVSGGRVTVPLAHNASVSVSAQWSVAAVPANDVTSVAAQFKYDEPSPADAPADGAAPTVAWAQNSDHIHASPSKDESQPANDWTVPNDTLKGSSQFQSWLATYQGSGQGGLVHLVGSASAESRPNLDYNLALSTRRIWATKAYLQAQGVTNFDAPDAQGEQGPNGDGRGAYRRVVIGFKSGGSPATTAGGSVSIARPPRKAPPPVQIERSVPGAPGTSDIQFKEGHLRVQIDHNRLIAVEVKVKVDVTTALESYLSKVQTDPGNKVPGAGQGAPPSLPVGKKADPNDGVLNMRMQLTLDDTVGRWQIVASLFEDDPDGFLQTPPPTAAGPGSSAEQFWRTYFGVLVTLTPLLDAIATANAVPGDVVALAVGAGVPLAAAGSGLVKVPRITCRGGEFRLTHDPSGTRGALLLDMEVALVISLQLGTTKLIDTDPKNPITVRYEAIGFASSDKPSLGDVIPVFDSSKGYTINIPSGGGINVPQPLGDIIQVLDTRIARSNPVNLELDLGLKADLGVVSVDRTTVRIPFDGSAPTLTALGVHIDVPGAIEGSGYLAIYPDGFGGQLDVSLPGIGVRVVAGLSVRHVTDPADPNHTATAVLVTLEVDFPVPIALGCSGLGLYGFGGLFALHFKRDEDPNAQLPALDWFSNRVHPPGNPMDINGWKPEIDHWAIGLGALLGTMDDGFVLNVKGMIIFEMPGPRILFVMKAKIIQPRPDRKGDTDATILAVIDLDLGREMISVGIMFDYKIDPLLLVHVPVRAVFHFDDVTNFAVDAGEWYNPATVTFFDEFTAHGYFMIRGHGIPDPNFDAGNTEFPRPGESIQLSGFSIATGVSVSFIWGDQASGLYLSVGASVDVGLGFAPILFVGELKIWGELHLWIIGIEASARLTLTAGTVNGQSLVLIEGEVHGKIDLFFFTLEGSVHVTLGTDPGAGPPAPPNLVTGVSLHSRSAALLTGSGLDRPIDGKLTDADPAGPVADPSKWVPIDAIPVIHFDCVPRVADGGSFAAQAGDQAVSVAIGPPSGSVNPAVRRGKPYYAYRVKAVSLSSKLTAGDVLIVWWTPNPGKDPMSPETKVQLALLSRVPSPWPSAVERSKHLTADLTRRWSTVCDPVAPPTSVLWTFDRAPLGPSAAGWTLRQGLPWPDPPGSYRSVPPRTRLDVAEPWRTGNLTTDLLKPVYPARVLGAWVPCDVRCHRPGAPSATPGGQVSRPDELADAFDLRYFFGANVATVVTGERQARTPAGNETAPAPAATFFNDTGTVLGLGLNRGDFYCPPRVLEAPYRRPVDPSTMGPAGAPAEVKQVLDAMFARPAQAPPRLDDALAFSAGETRHLRLLLWVPRVLLGSGRLVVRCFDAKGALLADVAITGTGGASRVVNTLADLPGPWRDPNGPWFCPVAEALIFLAYARAGAHRETSQIVLVDLDAPAGTTFFNTGVVGIEPLLARMPRPSYLVGAVETLSAAEVLRESQEQKIASQEVQTINGALAPAPNPPALLLPNTDYVVNVDWEWAVADENGAVADGATWTPSSQPFHFHTDTAPLQPPTVKASPGAGHPEATMTMPVRLDPWVLLTDPDEGERFFFHDTHLTVIVAVDYLLNMFTTYGVALQAKARAASYRNADPGSPSYPKTVQQLTPAVAAPVTGAAVFTPWEATAREVLAQAPCVNTSGQVSRHQAIKLNLLLEPITDYILDIEPVNAPAPPPGTTVTPLFRRKFTTSRYPDVAAMCAAVAALDVVQAPAAAADLADLVKLGSTTGPVSASALDAALAKAGLHPSVPVDSPTADLLWVPDVGGLQPRVLVLRTPEPLLRTRRVPRDYEPPGQPRLGRKVTRLESTTYLEIVATPGAPAGPAFQVVGEPGMGTLVVLITSGRGKALDLSLRQHESAFIEGADAAVDTKLIQMNLAAAPWEEV
jgi:hypothetical protein